MNAMDPSGGIVALEAAAAGAPLVLADTGGLAEIGQRGAAAMFAPGDVPGLVAAVVATIADGGADRPATARASLADRFAWPTIAARTAAVAARAFAPSP